MFGRSSRSRGKVVGLLDLGSGKFCCLIVESVGAGRHASAAEACGPRVLGSAIHRARGIKAGMVVDPRAAEIALRETVAKAEEEARVRLDSVVVNLSCGRMGVLHFRTRTDLETGRVARPAAAKLQRAAESYVEREGRIAIDLGKPRYSVDRQPHAELPLRAPGRELSATYSAITADDGPVDGIGLLVQSCELSVDAFIPSGLASAFSVTTEEERELGVITVDIGAGCINFAVLADGVVLDCGSLPMGGGHITSDIARALGATIADAERLKTLHGSLFKAHSDAATTFTFSVAADTDGDVGEATRAELHDIMRPRVRRQLVALGERLSVRSDASDFPIVFTGGGSAMPGLVQCAANVLQRRTRLGVPDALPGRIERATAGTMATVAGLAHLAAGHLKGTRDWQERHPGTSYLRKMHDWVRESF